MPHEYDHNTPGVIPVGKQDTSHVAEEALREQAHGDEFKTYEPAEIEKCRNRLDEIRGEIGQLYADLYPAQPNGLSTQQYKGPDYKRQMEIKQRIALLEKEETGIRSYLRTIYEAFDGAGGALEQASGPFGGSAVKIIGED